MQFCYQDKDKIMSYKEYNHLLALGFAAAHALKNPTGTNYHEF
jgi:hypothetical protein